MFNGSLVENQIGKEPEEESKLDNIHIAEPTCIICKAKFDTETTRDQHLIDEHGINIKDIQNRPNSSLEAFRGDNYRSKIPNSKNSAESESEGR